MFARLIPLWALIVTACTSPFLASSRSTDSNPESGTTSGGAGQSTMHSPGWSAGGNFAASQTPSEPTGFAGQGGGTDSYSGRAPTSTESGAPLLGLAGSGGESGAPPSEWAGCHIQDGICQCYRDDVFESGWLSDDTCENSDWCTIRQDTACVCWAAQEQWEGALKNEDTREAEQCP